tara:strand:+ start:19193 stop:19714 length:522 start_codon:yes stop_codon:yes gene_type:complete
MFTFSIDSDSYKSLKNVLKLELYDSENYTPAVISAVCSKLYECKAFTFKLCFGDGDEIELPIDCEFSIFLEQLPDVMNASKNENVHSFIIRFFEQGFNFSVLIQKNDGIYSVSFDTSHCDGIERKGYEIEFTDFELMLQGIAQDFMNVAIEIFPELSNNKAFKQWGCEIGITG